MRRFFKSSYFAIILALIYLPIGVMVLFSFNKGTSVSNWIGFGTNWYSSFFHDATFIKSIVTTLFVAVVSTIVSLIIGVSAAIGLSKLTRKKQNRWLTISNIPLINADIITAVALMVIFLLTGIKFGIFTLIMAHISFNVPYVIITVMPRLRKIDSAIIEASNDLGAKSSTVIFKVILPILKPAIILAAVIAFAMSFDDFIISYFTGGAQQNVSGFIYTAKRIKPFIFAFGTIMVAIIAIAVLIWNAFLVSSEKSEENKAKLKNGTYKQKQIYYLNSQLEKQKQQLESLSYVKKTWNVFLWIHYFALKSKFRRISAKNFDKKISKLEWKIYKIKNEINQEKKYKTKLLKLEKRQISLNKQLALAKDVKKAAKLTIELEKVAEEIDFLNEEIEWVEKRDSKASIQAKSINEKLQNLIKDRSEEVNPTKSTIKWYDKKIKYYQDWKIEVEEGKNNYKLRLAIEKLKLIKQANENKLLEITNKLNLVQSEVFVVKPINENNNTLAISSNNSLIEKFKLSHQKNIKKLEVKIKSINSKITKANKKYFWTDTENVRYTQNFFARSWKMILVILIVGAALSGLTVAFIKNNIYDLTIGNWGEYIDRSLLTEFEQEHNIKINYQEYDSNETLYNKLYTFSYDLMVPSDYMVQKLAEEGKLETLDYSKLNVKSEGFYYLSNTGQKLHHNGINAGSEDIVDPETGETTEILEINTPLLNTMGKSLVSSDNLEESDHSLNTGTIIDYSLNYLWGDLTIVLNPNAAGSRDGGNNITWLIQLIKDKPDEYKGILTKSIDGSAPIPVDGNEIYDENATYQLANSALSWGILWEAAAAGKKVILNEDPKNMFAIGGQKLYGKGNITSQSEVLAIEKELETLIAPSNVGLEGDSLIQTAADGRFDFAVMYNGDASYANLVWNGEDSIAGDEGDINYKADADGKAILNSFAGLTTDLGNVSDTSDENLIYTFVTKNSGVLLEDTEESNFTIVDKGPGWAVINGNTGENEETSEPNNDLYSVLDTSSLRVTFKKDFDRVRFLYGRPNKYNTVGKFNETTNIYSDNLVMSKDAKNKDLAYEFINFIVANASGLSEFTGTPTPYTSTLDEMTEPDGYYADYKGLFLPVIYPTSDVEGNLEPFFYNGAIDNYLVDRYTTLIAGKQS